MGLVEEHPPEHPHQVEGGERVGEQHHASQHGMPSPEGVDHQPEAPEASQGKQAREPRGGHQIGGGGGGHAGAQAAEFGEVLAVGGGNHAAHAHEQQRLGQTMGEQEKQRQQGLLERDGQKHQSQIGGGAIGEGALEIHLGDGHQGTADGTDRAHHHQHFDRHRRQAEQRHQLEQHQGAAGHHGGVAQDRGRVRAFHRLIEPQMHRKLGALAHRPGNQSEAEQRGRQGGEVDGVDPAVQVGEFERARPGRKRHQGHEQEHIAHPLGEEGIAGCRHYQGLGIPETDEQVGGEGEHLQQEIAHEQVAAQHHTGHGPFEEAHQRIKAGQRPFLVEIAQGKDLAEEAHEGHELQGGQVGEREVEADAQIEVAGPKPGDLQVLRSQGQHLPDDQAAVQHSHQGHQKIQVGRGPGSIALDPAGRPGQRQHHAAEPVERDQPDQLDRQGQGEGQEGETSEAGRSRRLAPDFKRCRGSGTAFRCH